MAGGRRLNKRERGCLNYIILADILYGWPLTVKISQQAVIIGYILQ